MNTPLKEEQVPYTLTISLPLTITHMVSFLSFYWLVYNNYNQWSPNTQFVKSNSYVTDFPFVKVSDKSRTKHSIQSTDKIICTAYSEHVAL
jgi:hypothetical protein